MTNEEFEAFKKAWLDYPSQDNEGYIPDRGGFKCGWFAALDWVKSQKPQQTKDKAFIDVMVAPEVFEEALHHLKESALRNIGVLYAKKYATSEEWYQVEWYDETYQRILFKSKEDAMGFMELKQGSNLMKKIRYTLG